MNSNFRGWILKGLILTGLLTAVSAIQVSAAPLQQTTYKVYITDVRGTSFVVSWATDTLSDGHVDYDVDGGSRPPPTQTAPDPVASTTTHYVTLTGLTPLTTYYFQIRSGATTDDNGGAYYSVTTGPDIISVPENKYLFGYVFESDDTKPIPNAIVYIQIQDNDMAGSPGSSQWVTARTDGTGGWFYSDLNNVRVASAGSSYAYSTGTDNLQLVAQGGSIGTFGEIGNEQIFPVPLLFDGTSNQFNMSVGNTPTNLDLQTFTAQVPRAALDLTLILIISFCTAGMMVLKNLWGSSRQKE